LHAFIFSALAHHLVVPARCGSVTDAHVVYGSRGSVHAGSFAHSPPPTHFVYTHLCVLHGSARIRLHLTHTLLCHVYLCVLVAFVLPLWLHFHVLALVYWFAFSTPALFVPSCVCLLVRTHIFVLFAVHALDYTCFFGSALTTLVLFCGSFWFTHHWLTTLHRALRIFTRFTHASPRSCVHTTLHAHSPPALRTIRLRLPHYCVATFYAVALVLTTRGWVHLVLRILHTVRTFTVFVRFTSLRLLVCRTRFSLFGLHTRTVFLVRTFILYTFSRFTRVPPLPVLSPGYALVAITFPLRLPRFHVFYTRFPLFAFFALHLAWFTTVHIHGYCLTLRWFIPVACYNVCCVPGFTLRFASLYARCAFMPRTFSHTPADIRSHRTPPVHIRLCCCQLHHIHTLVTFLYRLDTHIAVADSWFYTHVLARSVLRYYTHAHATWFSWFTRSINFSFAHLVLGSHVWVYRLRFCTHYAFGYAFSCHFRTRCLPFFAAHSRSRSLSRGSLRSGLDRKHLLQDSVHHVNSHAWIRVFWFTLLLLHVTVAWFAFYASLAVSVLRISPVTRAGSPRAVDYRGSRSTHAGSSHPLASYPYTLFATSV